MQWLDRRLEQGLLVGPEPVAEDVILAAVGLASPRPVPAAVAGSPRSAWRDAARRESLRGARPDGPGR